MLHFTANVQNNMLIFKGVGFGLDWPLSKWLYSGSGGLKKQKPQGEASGRQLWCPGQH